LPEGIEEYHMNVSQRFEPGPPEN